MDISLERDGTAIGSLFQQIITDMKNSNPLWEDLMAKASKLHACLRATIQAIAAYLDAFQKIADAATNSKGATKEIGTALTRVCLRHKAVETRMKSFTSAIMDCLVIPLTDKLEDWKRQVAVLDKDHAKEHKRCRTELKKRSSDTLRLQKKARKGQSDTIQSQVETSMQDINARRAELEDVERKSLRAVMVEERTRYCTFVNLLQPVVKEECEIMYELGHLQEAMDSIALVTKDPTILPQSSEEIILESKASFNLYPESPGGNNHGCSNSLGSRKSSICSISSMNSSGSSGSPSHQYQRSLSQLISPAIRLKPGESSDSGFCSSPALTLQASTSTNQTHAVSTWPPLSQDVNSSVDRPHTISSTYEKGHQRPALTVHTFQNPDTISDMQKSPANIGLRPPLPIRCSSLERPLSTSTGPRQPPVAQMSKQSPSPLPAHLTKESPIFQPTYVNMTELASMAASKQTTTTTNQQISSPVLSIASSLISSDSSATNHQSSPDVSTDTITSHNNSIYPDCSSQSQSQSQSQSHSLISSSNQLNNKVSGEPSQCGGTDTGDSSSNTDNSNNDIKCTGSVLAKLSMFERLEQRQIQVNMHPLTLNKSDTNLAYSTRKTDDIYKNSAGLDADINDQNYEDSIQQLNNLIGELDLFQKEHDIKRKTATTQLIPIPAVQPISNGPECDTNCDKISIGSSNVGSTNYSINSDNSSDLKFSYNDNDCLHNYNENSSGFVSNQSEIIHLIDGDNLNDSELYLKENTEIVVLRRKDSATDLNNMIEMVDDDLTGGQQRFSSFKCDGKPAGSQQNNNQLINDMEMELRVNITDDKLRYKPVISPRPASLSGCVSRITRRSSVNTTKPPPPIRRSSSVTPNPNLIGMTQQSPQMIVQQNQMNVSSENFPPPPAYLLDATTGNGKVNETVKVLTELRHMPASPGVVRRAQAIAQMNAAAAVAQMNAVAAAASPPISVNTDNFKSPIDDIHKHNSQNMKNKQTKHISPNTNKITDDSFNRSPNTSHGGIYAQPKVSKVSSFRNPSPGSKQITSSTLIAQLNARLTPKKSHQPPIEPQQVNQMINEKIYAHNQVAAHQLYESRNQPIPQPNRSDQKQKSNSNHPQHYYTQQQQVAHQHYYNQNQSTEQIYNRSGVERNHYYQTNQLASGQQTGGQQSYGAALSIDGKNPIYLSQPPTPHPIHNHQIHQKIYVSTNPFITTSTQPLLTTSAHYSPTSSFGKEAVPSHSPNSNYPQNYNKSGSVRCKSKSGFLENLNAKLAEQRLSGKAFAVRNLINSKALPDPRLCHESLMDQIKRGATLKRNKSINDRSAPKIH